MRREATAESSIMRVLHRLNDTPYMPDDRDGRLEALELKIMEFELAQSELDAVVISQGAEISQLTKALEAALARLDASKPDAPDDSDSAEGGAIVHELPPHY